MAEGARLESVYTFTGIGGSNPSLSAITSDEHHIVHILMRTAKGAKHDPEVQGDRKAFERRLRELAILAIAAMKK